MCFMKHILALSTWHHTLWKLQDFSKIQILREINFGESRSSKIAIFAIFGTAKFVNLINFNLPKSVKIHNYQNSDPLNGFKWPILHL